MKAYFIRQAERPTVHLVFDIYVAGMLTLCIVGGFIL